MPVKKTISILDPVYYEYGDLLHIDTKNKKVAIYSEMDFERYILVYKYDYDFNANLNSGDKVSVAYDDNTFTLKIYVNKVLASDISIGRKWQPNLYYTSTVDYIVDFRIFKHALDLSGNAGYNVTQFNNNTAVPAFCYKDYTPTPEYDFPASFTNVKGAALFESGITYKGIANCLKIYPSTALAFQTANIEDFAKEQYVSGVYKKVTITFYYPPTNVKSTCVKFVSASDYTVYPSENWQTITFYKSGSYAKDTYQYVSFRNATNGNFAGSGTGEDDVIYISKVSLEFACHCIFDINDIKSVDNVLINKAFNSENSYFPYLYKAYSERLIPTPIGRNPLSIQLNVGSSLTNFLNSSSMNFTLWRIDAFSTRAPETTYTLSIGSEDMSISLKAQKIKYLYLESPISLNNSSAIIGVSSANASASDTITLKLYFE